MEATYKGKVRDIYDIADDRMVIVTSDRISAYDVVMPMPVKGKGIVLNSISNFWFGRTSHIVKNHLLSADTKDMPEFFRKPEFEGRTVMVKKLKMLPFEIVVRGYIFGNMWKAYEEGQPFCGNVIKGDYKLAQKLETPIITHSTNADVGHDEYIELNYMRERLGAELADKVCEISLKIYNQCGDYALSKGIIIADTKFEFGLDEKGELVLADEILTPDSSRFWNRDEYTVGVSPKSYDKQFIRDWLTNNKKDGEYQFDKVPDEVIRKTEELYKQCLERLTK
jgi:phosphoribosylaminoimidazole-succinocarboxamide synthase